MLLSAKGACKDHKDQSHVIGGKRITTSLDLVIAVKVQAWTLCTGLLIEDAA